MTDDKWGAGRKSEWLACGGVLIGNQRYELYIGEHPHSRQYSSIYANVHDVAGGDDLIGFDGHRVCMSFEIREFNYIKSSGLSGTEVRKGCDGLLKMDGKLVYQKFFRRAEDVLIWFTANMCRVREHPCDLSKGDGKDFPDVIGQKVWYRDEPGIVSAYFADQGAVIIDHDPTGERASAGFPQLASLREDFGDEVRSDAKCDILSDWICWHRKT